MDPFERAFVKTLPSEGRFSNNAKDRGGPTKYGITEVVARANGYEGSMADLTLDEAKRIARLQYWDLPRLDQVADVHEKIAAEMFDTGYNMGIGIAARFLQRALNVLNRQGRDFPDLTVDGITGPVTLHRFRAFNRFRGGDGLTVLFRALNGQQVERYITIAENDPEQEEFVFGWILRRVEGL